MSKSPTSQGRPGIHHSLQEKPLCGFRVLDLTIVVAGPVGAGLLADLGAEVIKIEHVIARRDVSDALPMAPDVSEDRPWNRSSWFHDLNRSKKALTLNLAVPQAKQALLHLVSLADVLMENFSPRVMPNLGLHYEAVRQVNPAIIMVSMPGFGGSGPMRDRTSFGPGIEAMTGLGDLTGYRGGPPLKPGNYVTDYNAAMLAAFAVMAALHNRRRTGLGRRIEVPLREGAIQMIGDKIVDYSLTGQVPARMGNRHAAIAPHGVYPCRGEDHWIALAVATQEDWEALKAVMGNPGWAGDGRYATTAGRLSHQDELDACISAWTRARDHIELMHLLQEHGLDAAACLTTEEVAADPHFLERGIIQEVHVPESGPARYPRYGFQLDRTPVRTGAGPAFGAHNREVLQGLVGMSEEEFLALNAAYGASDRPVPPGELPAPGR